jgi:hypothetical protein
MGIYANCNHYNDNMVANNNGYLKSSSPFIKQNIASIQLANYSVSGNEISNVKLMTKLNLAKYSYLKIKYLSFVSSDLMMNPLERVRYRQIMYFCITAA